MGVYNAEGGFESTVASVIKQEGCTFELIVVDDGSTDGTSRALHQLASRDVRVRVVRQNNSGLTQALIRGCEIARGDFIARQDAGDVSLPNRLATQVAFLRAHPDTVMVACGVEFLGPHGEVLYTVRKPMRELDAGLRQTSLEKIVGPPHHGGVMFRREAYQAAGGYRSPFFVAQDLDLWLRLAEQGACLGMAEVLYRASLEPGSISSRSRPQQLALAALALQCRQARAAGADEAALLAHAPQPTTSKGKPSGRELARFHYFIASCMRSRNSAAARSYYRAAVENNPLHLMALARWLMTR